MITGYKATNHNMKCRDMKYRVGLNVLNNNHPLEVCENGLHFCEELHKVAKFYPLFSSDIWKCSSDDPDAIQDYDKTVVRSLTLERRLSAGEIVDQLVVPGPLRPDLYPYFEKYSHVTKTMNLISQNKGKLLYADGIFRSDYNKNITLVAHGQNSVTINATVMGISGVYGRYSTAVAKGKGSISYAGGIGTGAVVLGDQSAAVLSNMGTNATVGGELSAAVGFDGEQSFDLTHHTNTVLMQKPFYMLSGVLIHKNRVRGVYGSKVIVNIIPDPESGTHYQIFTCGVDFEPNVWYRVTPTGMEVAYPD